MATLIPEREEFGREIETAVEQADPEDRVPLGQHLTERQQRKLRQIIQEFAGVLSEALDKARDAIHKNITLEGKIVQEKWRNTIP